MSGGAKVGKPARGDATRDHSLNARHRWRFHDRPTRMGAARLARLPRPRARDRRQPALRRKPPHGRHGVRDRPDLLPVGEERRRLGRGRPDPVHGEDGQGARHHHGRAGGDDGRAAAGLRRGLFPPVPWPPEEPGRRLHGDLLAGRDRQARQLRPDRPGEAADRLCPEQGARQHGRRQDHARRGLCYARVAAVLAEGLLPANVA